MNLLLRVRTSLVLSTLALCGAVGTDGTGERGGRTSGALCAAGSAQTRDASLTTLVQDLAIEFKLECGQASWKTAHAYRSAHLFSQPLRRRQAKT